MVTFQSHNLLVSLFSSHFHCSTVPPTPESSLGAWFIEAGSLNNEAIGAEIDYARRDLFPGVRNSFFFTLHLKDGIKKVVLRCTLIIHHEKLRLIPITHKASFAFRYLGGRAQKGLVAWLIAGVRRALLTENCRDSPTQYLSQLSFLVEVGFQVDSQFIFNTERCDGAIECLQMGPEAYKWTSSGHIQQTLPTPLHWRVPHQGTDFHFNS